MVEETEQLESDLLSEIISLRSSAQVDFSAIQLLKSLISDLESSEAIDDAEEACGRNRVHTLSLAVTSMETHLNYIESVDAVTEVLSQEVTDLQLQLRQEPLQIDAARLQEIT